MSERPPIPRPMKRAVRQACGFGCVFCGYPLYEIHHIVDYNIVQEHKEDNLCLLCDKHHRLATNKLLSEEKIRSSKEQPFNIKNGTTGLFEHHYHGGEFAIRMGNNLIGGVFNENRLKYTAILMGDQELLSFRFEYGILLLSMDMRDEENVSQIIICDNEMILNSKNWDIEFEGQTLTVRRGERDIFARIIFDVPNRQLLIEKGVFHCDGLSIFVESQCIRSVGFGRQGNMSGCVVFNSDVGLVFGCPNFVGVAAIGL